MADDAVIHSGELVKAPPLGTGIMSSIKSWKKRFFILRKASLEYYADTTAQKLLGIIDLNTVESIQMKCPHPKYNHLFSLLCTDRQYLFAAETDRDRVAWVTKIKGLLSASSPSPADDPGPETETFDAGSTGEYHNFENVRQYQHERKDSGNSGAASDVVQSASAGAGSADPDAAVVAKAKVVYDFKPTNHKQLDLKAGEVVEVLDNLSLWWVVRRADGKEGLAPSNFLEKVNT